MPQCVANGAMLMCNKGLAPSSLMVLPQPVTPAAAAGQTLATIMDNIPMLNIKPFGNCTSTAYPPTIAATSAAMGALTPMPCVPLTPGPWSPGSSVVKVNHKPAVLDNAKLTCVFGGQISITMPGQFHADAKS